MLKPIVGLMLLIACFDARADKALDEGRQHYEAGRYTEAYMAWWGGAIERNSEKQELLANLLLGPHRHALKRIRNPRREGMRYLYRAAIAGRRSAMLSLAEAARSGLLGVERRVDAAECWSKAPASLQDRIACVELTEFRDREARASCSELALAGRSEVHDQKRGPLFAKLCIANKTPALLVPGAPPSAQDERREREYAKHGIQWVITGDVYDGDFEQFRENFNDVIVAGVEAERGRGYFQNFQRKLIAA
ncbi:MAG TPA: hypothetical protein VHV83_03245 [Armatimonadota bacterium]|nr:hypothetical protein [Armatimonadota bacterium]